MAKKLDSQTLNDNILAADKRARHAAAQRAYAQRNRQKIAAKNAAYRARKAAEKSGTATAKKAAARAEKAYQQILKKSAKQRRENEYIKRKTRELKQAGKTKQQIQRYFEKREQRNRRRREQYQRRLESGELEYRRMQERRFSDNLKKALHTSGLDKHFDTNDPATMKMIGKWMLARLANAIDKDFYIQLGQLDRQIMHTSITTKDLKKDIDDFIKRDTKIQKEITKQMRTAKKLGNTMSSTQMSELLL